MRWSCCRTTLARDLEDAKLLVQVIDCYHRIGSEEAIRTFKLGFANRTLGYRLPEKNQVDGAAHRHAAQ